MKTCEHPILPVTLTFMPETHVYRDGDGMFYESVTTFVKGLFEPFDEEAYAAAKAARERRLEIEILTEWRKKREAAADYGTRVHAYAEAVLLGQPSTVLPTNDNEKRAFKIVDKALLALSDEYEFLPPEQIIFDPMFAIAGTIDLPARNKKSGALAILDWKTCEGITADSYHKVAKKPINHVPDSKLAHYSLQLSLYAWLLADPEWSSYPSKGEPVEMAMIHIPPTGIEPVWRPCTDYRREAKIVMLAKIGKAA